VPPSARDGRTKKKEQSSAFVLPGETYSLEDEERGGLFVPEKKRKEVSRGFSLEWGEETFSQHSRTKNAS